jgi:HSP20 family molecular chaperone IbpA
MWTEALSLMDEAERLRRQFFRMSGAERGQAAPVWEPPADVIETADAVLVHIALPGVEPESLAITGEPEGITVSASRAFPLCSTPGARIHRVEIPYGRFERRIVLPMHALEVRSREFTNGCLTLTFGKKETA